MVMKNITVLIVFPVSGDGASSDRVDGTDDNPEATCSDLTQGTLYSIAIQTVKDGFVMESCSGCRLTNGTGS